MALIDIKVPDIGDFKDVAVIEVLVKPGDTVKVEQSLITVESDKASMEIPSSHAGVVKELKVKVGDTVNEGSVILSLDEAAAGARAAPAPAPRPRRLLRGGRRTARRRPRRHQRGACTAPAAAPRPRSRQLRRRRRPRVRHARARRRPGRLLGRLPRRRPRHEDRAGRALRRRSAACA